MSRRTFLKGAAAAAFAFEPAPPSAPSSNRGALAPPLRG
jgi:hypothetical protein